MVLVAGTGIAAVELAAGFLGNSLVLLSDGAHYVADLVAVALAIGAVSWSARPADPAHSFGHQRAEVLACFANGLLLGVLTVLFAVEAVARLLAPVPVNGLLLVAVGAFTFGANFALAILMRRGDPEDLNQRAVYLHILSDGVGSVGAVVAGLLVVSLGWTWADPAATLFVVALMTLFTVRLLRPSLHILMEGTPEGIEPEEVASTLRGLPSVQDIHDLHVWTLAPGTVSVSVHVVVLGTPTDDRVVHEAQTALRRRYRILHATIQIEAADCPCAGARH